VGESAGSPLELAGCTGCVPALGSGAGRHEHGRDEAARADAVRLVGEARLHDGAQVGDERGELLVGQAQRVLPVAEAVARRVDVTCLEVAVQAAEEPGDEGEEGGGLLAPRTGSLGTAPVVLARCAGIPRSVEPAALPPQTSSPAPRPRSWARNPPRHREQTSSGRPNSGPDSSAPIPRGVRLLEAGCASPDPPARVDTSC
jgi:hypothetical protein